MTEQKADSQFLARTGFLVILGICLFILGSLIGPGWAQSGEQILYNDFENGVKNQLYKSAYIDGNIIQIQTNDGKKLHTEAPMTSRAVDLLIKSGVPVTARPVPASGLTWPVTFILLVPYAVLAFYAFALANAATAASAPLEPPAKARAESNNDDSALAEDEEQA